ncbi:hypothetical protein CL633_00520 [bacterium]|nr:hypothetical protein [bacterium]|tara:strand:+ start:15610 stop:15993 length:384 start_codon:yes stop_codon:yes gene_type:complete
MSDKKVIMPDSLRELVQKTTVEREKATEEINALIPVAQENLAFLQKLMQDADIIALLKKSMLRLDEEDTDMNVLFIGWYETRPIIVGMAEEIKNIDEKINPVVTRILAGLTPEKIFKKIEETLKQWI